MSVDVTDHSDRGRFELTVDGVRAGFAAYRTGDGRRTFTHTEIEDRFGGRGLGTQLVAAALRATREQGDAVVPRCPFVRAYLAEHPDELDLVPEADRRAFGLTG